MTDSMAICLMTIDSGHGPGKTELTNIQMLEPSAASRTARPVACLSGRDAF